MTICQATHDQSGIIDASPSHSGPPPFRMYTAFAAMENRTAAMKRLNLTGENRIRTRLPNEFV